MDTPSYRLLTVCLCAFSAAVTAEALWNQNKVKEETELRRLQNFVHRQMKVVAGENVLLDCRSHQNDVTLLEWIRPDLKSDGYVFFYRERRSYQNYQHPDFRGRVTLGDPRMENGDMSVVLTNVQPDTDNGIYLCYVSGGTKGRGRMASSEIKKNITLTVSPAKPGNTQKQSWDGGNQEGNNDGSNRSRNGLIVFLSLCVVMAVVGFVVIRKVHKPISKEQKKNSLPPDDPAV